MMTTYNDLTIENRQAIEAKAKTRNDGVYTFRGIAYRVRKNRVTHFAYNGEVLEPCGNFSVVVGEYPNYLMSAVKLLRSI